MTFYLARHGETFANRENLILGRRDSPLTPSGIETVGRLSLQLAGRQVRLVITSPLGRAAASARLLAGSLGVEVAPCKGLAELSCGEWEGQPRQQVLPEGGELRSSWSHEPPGGESCQGAEVRVAEVIRWIQAHPNKRPLLVVGHTVINRVFFKLRLGLAPDLALHIRHPCDLIYVLFPDGSVEWFNAGGDTGTGLVTNVGSH